MVYANGAPVDGAMEITVFSKIGGPLTKRISLDPTGKVNSDGSHCTMSSGVVDRLHLSTIDDLGTTIDTLQCHQALTLGRLRAGLGGREKIHSQSQILAHGGITRSQANFTYAKGQPGFVLLDFDMKAMPGDVVDRMEALGGFEAAIASILPEIVNTARLVRKSTSAGLYRIDTGERFPGSGGLHTYLQVCDPSDAERFLKTLHTRLVIAGLGWMMLGAAGQMLERSLVDRSVCGPERLAFEGPPVVDAPLAQDAEVRRPIVYSGDALDTLSACPPPTIADKALYDTTVAKLKRDIKPDADKVRTVYVRTKAEGLAAQQDISIKDATKIIEKQCAGVLLPNFELIFDDSELEGTTVADVFADPDRYLDETLADPLDGVDYGRCKAKIMQRSDGSVFVHSLAHGTPTIYELKLDYAAVATKLNSVSADEAADLFAELVLAAHLTEVEIERLRDLVATKGIGKSVLNKMLKQARADRAAKEKEAESDNRRAERLDPRALIPAPAADAEWLPVMETLGQILGKSKDDVPPARDVSGNLATVDIREVTGLHLLVAEGEKAVPALPQMQIVAMSEVEASELIERHIEFHDNAFRSVHLGRKFVEHFMKRTDDLPMITGISTLPIVLPNGSVLTGNGLDRRSGIVFKVPDGLELPTREQCGPNEVAAAMDFLCHEWLVDVATDYEGKVVLIACAMTVIERMIFTERPGYILTAGLRASGKTTAVQMLAMAVTGTLASAGRWSFDDEERRKSLFSYLRTGCRCWRGTTYH